MTLNINFRKVYHYTKTSVLCYNSEKIKLQVKRPIPFELG